MQYTSYMKPEVITNLSLDFVIFKQEKAFIAYSASLDLATCGRTKKTAAKAFHEAANLFIEELIQKNSLDDFLLDMGWEKTKNSWKPPQVVTNQTIKLAVPFYS